METILIVVAVVLTVAVLALLVWLISVTFGTRKEIAAQAAGVGLLQQQLEALKAAQDKTSENLQKSLQTGQTSLTQSLETSGKVISDLRGQIGELQGTNKQMLQVGTEVRRLQDILKSPKMRGQMGERSLENMLATILPKDSYELQYGFQDGKTVDALVKLADFSVSVDAKFPLPSFERLGAAETDDGRAKARKQFAKTDRIVVCLSGRGDKDMGIIREAKDGKR